MKSERKIRVAFILNLAFSAFEFFGGLYTGSVAIISDSVHDFGDAVAIGISCFFENKSKKQPDEKYSYGYARYSVLGGVITTSILIFGSLAVIYNAVCRIFEPTEIDYNGMIVFAIIGVIVNSAAVFFTREGDSVNQKAVNLHMLEDVLGWIVVLVGAVLMRFTDLAFVDSVMSIGVAVFILVNAIRNLKEAIDIFLEKTPCDIEEIKNAVKETEGVTDVHHIHVRSMDGHNNYATMHVVTNSQPHTVKESIRRKLQDKGIVHLTIEIETEDEHCHEKHCHTKTDLSEGHHHHHHPH